MIRPFLTTVFVSVLISCTPRKIVNSSVATRTEHSFEKIVDTIVEIRRDTTLFTALLECDSIGRVRIAELDIKDSEISSLRSQIKSNRLNVEVTTPQRDVVREVLRVDTIYSEINSIEMIEVNAPIPQWKRILMCIGVFYLLQSGFKLYRKFFPFKIF